MSLRDRWRIDTGSHSRTDARNSAQFPRVSNGLDQFFSALPAEERLSILDLAGANQSNISFVTNLGHRIYSDDAVANMQAIFGNSDSEFVENQADTELANRFLREALDFDDGAFDGALVWDTLQFLSPQLAQSVIDRLYRILRPKAALLAMFRSDEKIKTVPLTSYRILDAKTVALAPKGRNCPASMFNNRALEKMFSKYHSLKFFLTRDNLREVLVRR